MCGDILNVYQVLFGKAVITLPNIPKRRISRAGTHILVIQSILVLLLFCFAGCGIATQLNEKGTNPQKEFQVTPQDFALRYETVVIPVGGATLHGWFLPAENSACTIIVCGGNSGNKQFYLPIAKQLQSSGFNVFLFDYRGFGMSTGRVDLWAMVPDVVTVIHTVKSRPDTVRVGVMGISLGSVIAIGATARCSDIVDAVVVEGTFSPYQMISDRVGYFVAGLIDAFSFPAEWNVEHFSAQIQAPIQFIHGMNDRITPWQTAVDIFSGSTGRGHDRFFWLAPEAGHFPGIGGTYGLEYARVIERFFDIWLKGLRTCWMFNCAWKWSSSRHSAIDIDLNPAVSPSSLSRVPVEITVVESGGIMRQLRKWYYPASPASFECEVRNNPAAVFAQIPADSIREEGETWERESAYLKSMCEFEQFRIRLRQELHISRISGLYNEDIYRENISHESVQDLELELRTILSSRVDSAVKSHYADAFRELGECYEILDDKPRASECYKSYVELVPSDPFTYYRGGNANGKLGFDISTVADVFDRMVQLTENLVERAELTIKANEWHLKSYRRKRELEEWTRTEQEPLNHTSATIPAR